MWYSLFLEGEVAARCTGPTHLFIPNDDTNYEEELGVDKNSFNPSHQPFIMMVFQYPENKFSGNGSIYEKIQEYIICETPENIIVKQDNIEKYPSSAYLLCFVGQDNIQYCIETLIERTPTFGRILFNNAAKDALLTYAKELGQPQFMGMDENSFQLSPVIIHLKEYRSDIDIYTQYFNCQEKAEKLELLNNQDYDRIWNPQGHDHDPELSDIVKAVALFEDYCKTSEAHKFFTGHFLRRHGKNVREILDKKEFNNSLDALLNKIKDLKPSDTGSLTKRITYIEYQIAKQAYDSLQNAKQDLDGNNFNP